MTISSQVSTQKIRRVLVVGDDPEVVHILDVNLAYVNLKVISAQNGSQALIKAAAERPDIIIIDDELPDLGVAEICRQITGTTPAIESPMIIVLTGSQSRGKKVKAISGVDNYIVKPFDPKEVVVAVMTCLKRIERAENINPLTGLPDVIQVNNEIMSLIEQNKKFAIIYVDLDDFKVFNKVYGFPQGDRVIRLVAEILCEAVRQLGNLGDFVGHLGGDDFMVISTTPKVKAICYSTIADFDGQIRALYKYQDLKRGYIETEGHFGQKQQYPIMSLRAAVVSNDRQTFSHYLEVSEAATEQMKLLRRFQGSNCYFDICDTGIEAGFNLASRVMPGTHREELKTLHLVLTWLGFLTRELDIPVNVIKESLDFLNANQGKNLTSQQKNAFKTIGENASQLVRVVDELTRLTGSRWGTDAAVLAEVDLGTTFDLIIEQLKDVAEQRRIEIDIEGADSIEQLMGDAKTLTQSLFYALRSQIKSGISGDRIHIHACAKVEGFITIELINFNSHFSHQELDVLSQGTPEDMISGGHGSDLYLAKVLVQSIGGKFSLECVKSKGVICTLLVPKRWRSSQERVNTLLSAAETSRVEAGDQLENMHHILASTFKPMPPHLKKGLENLCYKVQELLVLCNRSLFLSDELNDRLEAQQALLLRQEVAQLAISEAILIISREIARLVPVKSSHLFDLENARRVAKYAIALAHELMLSGNERQSLHYAALLKDIGLVLSAEDVLEQKLTLTREEAVALGERFNQVWKALASIDFLSLALPLVLHRYDRYDGAGSNSGAKGADIPLGARILAVVDTFDVLTSGLSNQGKVAPKEAIQKIVADTGQRFDPYVVNAFVRAWRKKEFHVTPGNF
ncbi:MAG: hypothetical protein A2144_03475 [Chloroflexi bacterium RBG_16_50_9]|nr:MAG: hypothetical protein A2144_03475 [Chloroflexi bacterium RBG_16_50_9]